MSPSASAATIVVGVVPDQPVDVLLTAADFARRFGADLLCVRVESASITAGGVDGTWVSVPVDPRIEEEFRVALDVQLREQVTEALKGRELTWSSRAVMGVPSLELSAIADEVDAAMIVLGTREPGIRGTLHELVNGSVAAQLAHRQHRPVVVVPLSPDALKARRR